MDFEDCETRLPAQNELMAPTCSLVDGFSRERADMSFQMAEEEGLSRKPCMIS
jgi:hypothetical protein